MNHSVHEIPKKARYLVILIWLILLAGSLYTMNKNNVSFSELLEVVKFYFNEIRQSSWGYLLPLVYILVFISRPIFLIPTWVMNVTAFVFFGFWEGYFLVIIAEQISASLFYFFVKYLAADVFKNRIMKMTKKLHLNLHGTKKKEYYTVVALRFASLPFDFGTTVCALIGISYIQFILGTLTVSLPWVGMFFLTFESFASKSLLSGFFNGAIFIIFLLTGYILARRSGIIEKNSLES